MGGEGVWGGEILSIQNRKQNLYAKHQDEIHLNFSFCFEKRLFKFSLRLLLVKIMCRLQKLPMYSVFWQMSPFHNSPGMVYDVKCLEAPSSPGHDVTALSHPASQYSIFARAANLSFLLTGFNKISFILVLGIYLGDMTRWHNGTMAQ